MIPLTFGEMKLLCKVLILCFCFTRATVIANEKVGCGRYFTVNSYTLLELLTLIGWYKVYNFSALMPILDANSVNERIINGVPTGQVLPYQLQLRKNGSHYCGAVLISPSFALTAHHCFHTRSGILIPKEEFTVHAGGYTELANNTEHRLIEKQLQFVDKKGQMKFANPDIVLLKLNEPFKINEKVKPACLPSRPAEFGKKCIVSGWGHTGAPGEPVQHDLPLQATEWEVISNRQCEQRRTLLQIYGSDPDPIEDHEICLDSKDYDHKSGCYGDSGGPLVCGTDGGATIHGIVGRGLLYNCTDVENVSVFTDVFHFVDEIKQIIDQDFPCPTNDINYQDGFCDSRLNDARNCFDGGDCCGMEADFRYCKRLCRHRGLNSCKCRCQSDIAVNSYELSKI